MIKNKQLQNFLNDYNGDAEVIIIGGSNHEIKHIGMTFNKMNNKYRIVLASETPTHCCRVCGENVYRDETTKNNLGDSLYYCPTCSAYRGKSEVAIRL